MKKLSYLLSLLVLVFVMASSGCDSDDGDSVPAVDQVGATFSGTWGLEAGATTGGVIFTENNQDRTEEYASAGFSLQITYVAGTNGGSYTLLDGPTGGGLVPFAGSGTWVFASPETITADANAFNVIRQDTGGELTMSISNLGANNITIRLIDYDNDVHSSSRSEAVDGDWEFNLVR